MGAGGDHTVPGHRRASPHVLQQDGQAASPASGQRLCTAQSDVVRQRGRHGGIGKADVPEGVILLAVSSLAPRPPFCALFDVRLSVR